MRFRFANRVALALLVTAACDVEVPGDSESEVDQDLTVLASGPTRLANSTPAGLFASSGTLYWTSNDIDDVGPDFSLIWRGANDNLPGNETLIRQDTFDPDDTSFDEYASIVGASVGGAPFLYYVFNQSIDGFAGSSILQIPAGGGAPNVIGASNIVFSNELKTDGSDLFWPDRQFIYRVSVAGGPQATVVQDPATVIALDSTFVYYGEGPRIRRVRKTGGPREVIFTATSPITAIYVTAPASGPTGTVYWGEQGGAVRSMPVTGGATTTYRQPSTGRTVTAVGFDGSRVLWIDCQASGLTPCAVRKRQNGTTTTVSSGVDHAGHLQWDTSAMYWGQTGGLMKFVH
jgi:hypothetical protein